MKKRKKATGKILKNHMQETGKTEEQLRQEMIKKPGGILSHGITPRLADIPLDRLKIIFVRSINSKKWAIRWTSPSIPRVRIKKAAYPIRGEKRWDKKSRYGYIYIWGLCITLKL